MFAVPASTPAGWDREGAERGVCRRDHHCGPGSAQGARLRCWCRCPVSRWGAIVGKMFTFCSGGAHKLGLRCALRTTCIGQSRSCGFLGSRWHPGQSLSPPRGAGTPLPALSGAGGCSAVRGVGACPSCGHGSCRRAGVPGTSRGSGDDVLRRLGAKRGHWGLRSCRVCMAQEQRWHGRGGDGRGGICCCPPQGTRTLLPVGKGDSPHDPLVSHVVMKAGEQPGTGVSLSQEHGSLEGSGDAVVL